MSYNELAEHIRRIVSPSTVSISLKENRINYILLHFGSFNPPHIGHLDFLKDAYERLGTDIHMACAIVVPRSDTFIREHKYKDAVNPLILEHSVRARLYYSDKRLPIWAAVLDKPDATEAHYDRRLYRSVERTPEERMTKTLKDVQQKAKDLGLRLHYMALRGIEEDPGLDWHALSPAPCVNMMLVSTYGRQGKECLKSWDLGSQRWQSLSDPSNDYQLLQTALDTKQSALRGHVRVIRALNPTVSALSSTVIREGVCTEYDGNDPCEHALSWSLLEEDPIWRQWRDTRVSISTL